MADRPGNSNHFFRELKRRKVFRVFAMYAATAFIIMEAGDIMLPRLGLPDWTVTFLIILLIVGLPIALILSWIFDITPDGIKRTESLDETAEENLTPADDRRKLRTSDVIIAVLIVVVGFLVYPKIFNRDNLRDLRNAEGRISIAILPFENMSGDTIFNVWQGGVQNLLITALSNSEELTVRQYQTVSNLLEDLEDLNYASMAPQFFTDISEKLETKTLILGNILRAGEKIRLNARLVDAESEEIYKTYQVEGDSEEDIFFLADSLSYLLKNYLEIRKYRDDSDAPQLRGAAITSSSEAFKYYIYGSNAFNKLDMGTAIEWFLKSIEADSTFIYPIVWLSYSYNLDGNNAKSKYWCNAAYGQRERLPLEQQLLVDQLHAYFYGMPDEEIKYVEQLTEIDPLNPLYWHILGLVYYKTFDYEKAVENFGKALEIPKRFGVEYRNPMIYFVYGMACHEIGDHAREKEVLDLGLKLFPTHLYVIQTQAICALSGGKEKLAEEILTNYQSMRRNVLHCTEAMISTGLGYIYSNAGYLDEAEKGYRNALDLEPDKPGRMNELALFLIDNDIDVEEGLAIVDRAFEIVGDHYILQYTKGWGLYKLGRYEEAYDLLKKSWEGRNAYNHTVYLHLLEAEKALNHQRGQAGTETDI